MALVLLGHRAGDTSAENHREVVHDEHQAVVDDLAHGGKERQLQEGNHRGDGLIGLEIPKISTVPATDRYISGWTIDLENTSSELFSLFAIALRSFLLIARCGRRLPPTRPHAGACTRFAMWYTRYPFSASLTTQPYSCSICAPMRSVHSSASGYWSLPKWNRKVSSDCAMLLSSTHAGRRTEDGAKALVLTLPRHT